MVGRVDPCNAGHRDGRRVASRRPLSFSLSAPLTDPYTVRGLGSSLQIPDLLAEQPLPQVKACSFLPLAYAADHGGFVGGREEDKKRKTD